MPSSITITFNSQPTANVDIIFFRADTVLGLVQENFKNQRLGPREVQVDSNMAVLTIRFLNAFQADFNSLGLFTLSIANQNELTITKKVGENYFDTAAIVGNWGTINATSTPDPVTPELQSVTYTDIDCVNVQASLLFNDTLTSLNINGNIFSNPVPNPRTIDLPRGQSFAYTANISGESINDSITTPALWNLTEIRQEATNSGFVAEIIVVETGTNRNTLEYSLDNTNFVSSNIFPGLATGTYTAYVRDSYGCNQQAQFTVQENPFSTVNSLIVDFPLLNSFHFIKTETVNGCDTYQSELNTASFLEDGHTGRRFYHLIQTCDCVTTQFKSNYDTHIAKIYGCDGLELEIPIEKKSSNINQYDVRDNIISSVDDKLVFYINGGNIYDPSSDTVIGQNTIVNDVYQYNRIDSIVEIEDIGFASIKDISYVESLDAWAAITDVSYTGATELKKVTSNYNIKEYEIYEFTYDFENLEGNYFIGVTGTKDTNTFEYVTEYINVQEKHLNTDEIIHRHTKNKEIDYRTGITHLMRVPRVVRDVYTSRDENEIYNKDTTVISIDSDLFTSKIFHWGAVPTAIVRKIDELLGNDTLYINRQQYIKEETPELNAFGQGSNRYTIKPTLRIAEGNISGLSKLDVQLEVLKFSNASSFFTGEVSGGGYISISGGYLSIGTGNVNLR